MNMKALVLKNCFLFIRRKGKNKVAAQNCRRRKIDQIEELREKIGGTK